PLAWVGDHAYGLYLWHWPLLIFYMEIRDRDAIGIKGALVILAATLALAILMHRYVEAPLAQVTKQPCQQGIWANKPAIAFGIGIMAIGTITTSALSPATKNLDTTYGDLDADLYPGAAVHFMSEPPPEADMFPAPEDASERSEEHTSELQSRF